jgi:hypothetical protein
MSEMVSSIPIDKGIPIPPPNRTGRPRGKGRKYPIPYMNIGDSFLIRDTDVHRAWPLIYQTAMRYKIKVLMREVIDGTRVWRVA